MIDRHDLPALRVLFGRFLRPHLPLILLSSCLGLTVAAVTTLQPLVLAPIVDTATSMPAPAASWRDLTLNNVGATWIAWTGQAGRTWRVVTTAALAYVLLVALAGLTGFLNLRLITRVRAHLFRDLQESAYRHLLSLDLRYFSRVRAGDVASRLNHDALKVAQSAEPVIRGLIQSCAQLTLSMLVLLRTNATLTTSVVIAFAAHVAITRVLRHRIRRLIVQQVALFGDLASRVHETILGIRIVKSFGAERFEIARFAERVRQLESVMVRDGAYKNLEAPLREIADAAGLVVVLLMSFAAFAAGELTLSGFVLFVALARRSLTPAANIAESALQLQTILGSADRLLAMLDEKSTLTDGWREAPALTAGIRLDEVAFAYGETPVLKGISLEIRPGEVVALVGPSGAGKSTLVDLILRLYDPTAGRILWNGLPVSELTQSGYRQRFGVVSQEALIFNATVSENIAYGRPFDRAALAHAARVAHVDTFVTALPSGYDTQVGDRGIRLSGGERQRLAIARALYARPEVLVLDEATNALDAETEAAVHEALDAIDERLTVIVIAHRFSTVVRADRIVVMDGGRIEAVGTHQDLLRTSPLYERWCRQQLGAFPEAVV